MQEGKTNGITFRRWLMYCNRELNRFITSLIGEDFKKDSCVMERLLEFKDDKAVLKRLLVIKAGAETVCKDFIYSNTGITTL